MLGRDPWQAQGSISWTIPPRCSWTTHCTLSNCNTKHIRLLRTEQDAVLDEEGSYFSPWRGKYTGFFSNQRFISSLQLRSSQTQTASAHSPISLVLLLPKIVLLFVNNHSWNQGYLYGLCHYALISEANKIHRDCENNLLLWRKIMKCSTCYLFCTRECLLLKTNMKKYSLILSFTSWFKFYIKCSLYQFWDLWESTAIINNSWEQPPYHILKGY